MAQAVAPQAIADIIDLLAEAAAAPVNGAIVPAYRNQSRPHGAADRAGSGFVTADPDRAADLALPAAPSAGSSDPSRSPAQSSSSDWPRAAGWHRTAVCRTIEEPSLVARQH